MTSQQIQDGGRTPYWKSFLAISRRHIGRSTLNLEQRRRITCRYMSRDQNCNFRKFKMADGRRFENSIISISQPRIIRFWSNSVGRCTFIFPWWTFNKNSRFCKFKMADGRHIENRFLTISRRHIDRLMRNLDRKYRITWQYRSRDQNCNFRKFKMADGRHFENSIIAISQPKIIRFASNLAPDAHFHSEDGWLTKKIWIFLNSRWRTDAILKIVLAISRRHIGRLIRNLDRK